jgi:hypothetical protein
MATTRSAPWISLWPLRLQHSIFGDFKRVSVTEVEALVAGNIYGRVSR